jgi:hypothetical protein
MLPAALARNRRRCSRGHDGCRCHSCHGRGHSCTEHIQFTSLRIDQRTTRYTGGGTIEILAEIVVHGTRIELRDIAIYPRGPGPLTVRPAELLRAVRPLKDELADAGFELCSGRTAVGRDGLATLSQAALPGARMSDPLCKRVGSLSGPVQPLCNPTSAAFSRTIPPRCSPPELAGRRSGQLLDQRLCGPSLEPLGAPGPVDDEESVDLG